MMNQTAILSIVRAAVTGIWVLPVLILGILSLFLARRRSDRARVAFTWLKTVFPFAFLFLILDVVASVATVVLFTDTFYIDSDFLLQLDFVRLRAGSISALFERVTSALLLVTFVELGNGFMYARSHMRTSQQEICRFLSYFFAVLIIALGIAACAKMNEVWGDYYNDNISPDKLFEGFNVFSKLNVACDMLYWLLSLATIGYSATVVHFWKRHPLVRGIAIMFLVATILNCIRYTWFLGYNATYVINKDPRYTYVPSYISTIDSILNTQLLGVTLVLLFVIGVRKKNGLWTTPQPFHAGIAPKAWAGSQPQQQSWQQQQAYAPVPYYGQPPADGVAWQGHGPYGLQDQQPQQFYNSAYQQTFQQQKSPSTVSLGAAPASSPPQAGQGH